MNEYIQKILGDTKTQVFVDQAIYSGCGFIITLLLVRVLTPSNFGIYASILLFNYFILNISSACIIQPLQVTLAKMGSNNDYFSFAFYMQMGLIIFLGVSIFGLFKMELDIVNNILINKFNLILFVCSFLMHDFFRKLFLAQGVVKHALCIDAITCFIQVSLFGFAFLFVDLELSEVILIMGFSYLPALLISVLFLKPKIGIWDIWKSYFQEHVVQGKWLLMTSILQWWANNLYVIASGVFLGATALGALRVVQSIFGVLNLLFQTFENYTLPLAARLFQTSNEKTRMFLKNMNLKGALIVGVLLLLLFLFSEFFIVLIAGETYKEYSFLVKGIAILYFIIFAGYPTRIAIRMMELNHFFFTGYSISFLFSLLSFNFLLKEWHLWGAIIGLIINQMILITFWQYILYKNKFILWK